MTIQKKSILNIIMRALQEQLDQLNRAHNEHPLIITTARIVAGIAALLQVLLAAPMSRPRRKEVLTELQRLSRQWPESPQYSPNLIHAAYLQLAIKDRPPTSSTPPATPT